MNQTQTENQNENPADGPNANGEPVIETRAFDAEVHQLLKLMINALYSNREIFLRELVSNASDALDKLRFQALTDSGLQSAEQNPAIEISVDAEKHMLVIEDNGIGMTRDEVVDHIGTIARSGTARFLESLSGDQKTDAKMIGQFGVGFYSAFIVSDKVVVETRSASAGSDEAVRWVSDGKGEYTLETIEREPVGTRIELHLAEDHRDLLDAERVKGIVQHYSNHVSFPIYVQSIDPADDESETESTPRKSVNDTQALWTRPKTEISDDEYTEFYGGLSGDLQAPAKWTHHHVEGNQSYSMLLFLPSQAPYDLAWNRDDRHGLKLYIQRVFIMDAAEQLLPRYLRFVRGVVDSADLPLNVSREILQDSPLLTKIRAAVVRRSLDMIEKLAEQGGEPWQQFQREFGNVLKEGIIEDPDNRERIAGLLHFASTTSTQPYSVSLADYLERAGDEADAVWYLTAENQSQALASPHLEAFFSRQVEVLLLTDPVDAWLVNHLFEYQGKPLKSAASGQLDIDEPDQVVDSKQGERLAGRIKKALGDRVGNVLPSRRLTESASCIAEEASGMNLQMRRILKQAGQDVPEYKPDLEINVSHDLLQRLDRSDDDVYSAELAQVLLDQALLIDGGELADPTGFVKRVNRLLASGAEASGAESASPGRRESGPADETSSSSADQA
ncbi:MAG: molecular chaperone HtpG [Wenzhouxiangellaceae bacterium]|nr:molecular chaperone HtpG [Wenzhouxiangellaceae bacterium]